ncbi:MAG: DUF6421 family protein [Salinarimonas sp.]
MSRVTDPHAAPALPDAFVNAVDALGRLQQSDGRILPAEKMHADAALRLVASDAARLARLYGQAAYADALERDFTAWRETGLSEPPDFSRSRDALRAPDDGCPFFFTGPLRLANGGVRGWRMECFLALREEPVAPAYQELYSRYPHPKNICQSSHLLSGSRGLREGNNIVFFPENIQASAPLRSQAYAVFFFNKFHKIFNRITIPTTHAVVERAPVMNATASDPRRCYLARCVWGYLHDYFHHRGARPFDEHIAVKTRWFTGLLEEIKVDLQTWLACRDEDFIDSDIVAEFIFYDRAFRYPTEPDWAQNFDSGTGLLLLAMLHERGAVGIGADGLLTLTLDALAEAARGFIADVEAIEALDDEEYLCAARRMVHRYLPEAEKPRRFGLPEKLVGSRLGDYVGGRRELLAFDRSVLVQSLIEEFAEPPGAALYRAQRR